MTDDPITRREFERVVHDHERRLDGHDSLYRDLREAREELVKFVEALRGLSKELSDEGSEHAACRAQCEKHRDRFEKRIRALERFRWQIGGAMLIIVAIPSWLAVVMLFVGGE